MSQSIVISSINYDGELASVVFTPQGTENVINLGTVTLPFSFQPSLLTPPLEVYGTYTILVVSGDCPSILTVPRPTPTPTPTMTPTRTVTPTPTQTPTPSPSFDPCSISPTPTPTHTPTPSSSPTPENSKIYWGKFSGTSITSGDTNLLSSGYTTNPTNSYRILPTSLTPEYGYILIPTGLTQPIEFRDSSGGCFGFNVPFNNIGTIFIIDANGFSITYNIYRTSIPFVGSVNVWMC